MINPMTAKQFLRSFTPIVLIAVFMASCTTAEQPTAISGIATDTLSPLVSATPRLTATPVPSRTPLPTFTFTPSATVPSPTPSSTPTMTPTPPITGIVASLQTVNVREGPEVTFRQIEALVPGTGVEVLGQNPDGRWLNIRLEDGREGWISAGLVRVNPLPTAAPTATPSPDLTALALGTPLPTAVLGGGTITPTPPLPIGTPTPVVGGQDATPEQAGTLVLPIREFANLNATATALAGGIVVLPSATFTPAGNLPTLPPPPLSTPGATSVVPALPTVNAGSPVAAGPQQGIDVLAYCDARALGSPAPTNLRTGAGIDVFWGWYAQTPELLQQHIDNAIYEVSVNGVALTDWRQFRSSVRQQNDGNYWVYWYVPFGPLAAGPYTVTFRLTWTQQISDGYDVFGPGTGNLEERGTCTFSVAP